MALVKLRSILYYHLLNYRYLYEHIWFKLDLLNNSCHHIFISSNFLSKATFLFQLFTCKEELKIEATLKNEAVKQEAAIQQLLHLKSKVHTPLDVLLVHLVIYSCI